jgi:hypothetical protein
VGIWLGAEVEIGKTWMGVERSVFAVVDGKVAVEGCLFNHSATAKTVILSAGGETVVAPCNFSCQSVAQVLELLGVVSWTGLAFEMAEADALLGALMRKCAGCRFGAAVRPKRVPASIWSSLLLCINGMLVGVVCWRIRKILNMATRKDN